MQVEEDTHATYNRKDQKEGLKLNLQEQRN